MGFRHPGDTGPRDFLPERTFRVLFRNGVAITVRAQSIEDAKAKARAKYKADWHKSFGTQAADVGIASTTTQGG